MPLLFNQSAIDNVVTHRTSFSGADIKAYVYRPPYNAPDGAGVGSNDFGLPNSEGLSHELGSIQTLSISNFRVKKPVRALGHQLPMGFVRGGRLIGGSMIFAHLDTHPWNDVSFSPHKTFSSGGGMLRSDSGFMFDVHEHHSLADRLASDVKAQENYTLVGRKHQYDFTWDSQLFGDLMYPDEMPPFDVIVLFKNEAGALGKLVLHGVELQHEGMTFSIEDLFTEVLYEYVCRGMSVFQEGLYGGRLWSGPERPWNDDYALQVLK